MKTTAIRHLIAIVACMLSGILTSNAARALSKLAVTDVNGMAFTIEVYESSANNNSIDVIIYKNDNPSEKIYGQGTDLHRGFYYMNTDTGLFDIAFANGEFKKAQPFKNIFFIYCDEDNRYIAAKDTKDPGWRLAYKLLPPDPESDSTAANGSSTTNFVKETDFVAVGDFGPYLLDEETLVRELKSKGFSVETFGPPADAEDDMAVYIMLKATRNDLSNPAVVMLINGEDRLLAIGLSDPREIEAFAKELRNKNYSEENGIFFHPDCNMSKIAVKFSGNQIHIIQPFEMVPDDF